jgi:APA family basic amino acid/polyamine antiporter
LFFKQTGKLNKNAVPEYALWIQCAMACALCLSGQYGNLLDMVSFVVVLFYVLTIAGIFILRKKGPMPNGLTKLLVSGTAGYYILMGTCLLYFADHVPGCLSLLRLGIVLLGIPIYFIALARKKK